MLPVIDNPMDENYFKNMYGKSIYDCPKEIAKFVSELVKSRTCMIVEINESVVYNLYDPIKEPLQYINNSMIRSHIIDYPTNCVIRPIMESHIGVANIYTTTNEKISIVCEGEYYIVYGFTL